MAEKDAITELKERLNKDAKDIDAAIMLGNIFYDRGDSGQSILYYRLALDIDPARPSVRTDLGTMYWRNNDIGQAEQAFRDAIELDSGFGNAYVNLGLLLHRAKKNVTEARAVWEKLLTINPDHAAADKVRELLKETAGLVH